MKNSNLPEELIEQINDKVSMLVSLARILESNYNNQNDMTEADLWALVVVIKEHLIELLNTIQTNTKEPSEKHIS